MEPNAASNNEQIGIREIELLFNEQLLAEIKKLKLQHLSNVRGWVVFDESIENPKVEVSSGIIVNLYLTISDFTQLWNRITWKMIKDVLDRADKGRMQRNVSLLDVRKFMQARIDLHKKAGTKFKIINLENASDQTRIEEDIVELLPPSLYDVKVRQVSEVIVKNRKTGDTFKTRVPTKYEAQAIYEGKLELARKVYGE